MSDPVRRLLSQIVEERGLHLSTLSRSIGKSHAYLQQYLKRGVPQYLPERTRMRLADALKIEEWRLGAPRRNPESQGDGADRQFIYVEERDVRGGKGVTEKEAVVGQWPFPSTYVHYALGLHDDRLSLLEMRGDSMEPTLRSGDKLLVDHDDTMVAQPGVFALYDGDATVVKRVEKVPGSSPPQVMLISDNGAHGRYSVPTEDIKVAGRIVWFGRRL